MKKLHLSSTDRILTGVCGGLSESIGLNSNIIRGLFIVSLFLGGTGLIIYLLLFMILPSDRGKAEVIDVELDEPEHEGKIRRSRSDRMIAGVCAGLAGYLKWDVSVIRLIFVIMSISGGVGIILYLFFWFIFPEEQF